MTVAAMKVPALADNEVTTMRQPRRRKAGMSLAIDNPAKARIGVVKAKKLILPVSKSSGFMSAWGQCTFSTDSAWLRDVGYTPGKRTSRRWRL
jgi:hypothetical protein